VGLQAERAKTRGGEMIEQFFDDLMWAFSVMRARQQRRKFGFNGRQRFDAAMKPEIPGEFGSSIAYPDAFYFVQSHDVERAFNVAVANLGRVYAEG